MNKPVLSKNTVMVPTTVMVPETTYSLPVNPSSELSAGLVSLIALSEGQGNSFYDSVAELSYSAIVLTGSPGGAQPPQWFIPPQTPDYPWNAPAIHNAGSQAIRGNADSASFIPANTTGYSYAVLVQPLDTTTFGRMFDGTGAATITLYTNIPGKLGQFSTTWRNASGVAVNPYADFVVGEWNLVLCTVQQGLGVMYLNGIQVASSTAVDIAHSSANQSGQLVYNATGNGSGVPNANFSSFWVWNNRVLTAAEAAAMYTDPWAMLR